MTAPDVSPGVSWWLGPALGAGHQTGHQGEQCQWRGGGLPSP